ncbi:hypothetical protein UFOVP1672_25 [uncultured Caudovirales phage]|uniref:Uncharacterized protein n=1 Tax=uncultured Caudovirales phage TaxID=2100421 RepID=A0A6J5PXG0_9CAUD|nr:hypothetical protein UFOVP988_47 [uncultured Caudovirales phage]CAB4210858.1 hypothetical protein UFOVP1425_47 [uncultured Caudovirales phage]CAB4223346.1 hypothetical protein UFOVP1672_25 [uncultured Caudovirales phage]
MKLILVVLLLAVSACATEKRFDQGMQSYIGQPIENVVAKVGPPHRTFTNADGSRVLTWEDKRQVDLGPPYGSSFHECILTLFVSKDGLISSYTRRGNICKA